MGAEEAPLLHRITGLWPKELMFAMAGLFHIQHVAAGEGFERANRPRWPTKVIYNHGAQHLFG